MNRRLIAGLFLAGLLVALASAAFQHAPGYMDADYYYAGGLRIVDGQGAQEPYLWNYLNDAVALPAPSFAYWMPLTSLLASLGLALARPWGFFAARLAFIAIAACIPPLTALLSYRLTARPRQALLAGVLALFPGFYLPFLTTTDSFPIYMLLGSVFFLTAWRVFSVVSAPSAHWRFFVLGAAAGLMHMTRADGLLWLGAAGLVVLGWAVRSQDEKKRYPWWKEVLGQAVVAGIAVFGGYLLIAMPWYARNFGEWGSLFPPGGARAMWITEYEQTMMYPPETLTATRWLAAGWRAHFSARLEALGSHLQTAVAVQGEIMMFPFILLGIWKLRRQAVVRLGSVMWLVTAAVMTLVFPFAGVNGGFFHSGAALQPLWWALAPVGVDQAAQWYATKRRLESPRAMTIFLAGLLIAVGAFLSGLLYYQHVSNDASGAARLGGSEQHYREVERVLQAHGAQAGDAVLVNNPPGFWLASGRPAAVIPYGDEHALIAAALKYHAQYVVLETNNPHQLSSLYHGNVSPPELEYITSVGETKLFQIHPSGE